MWERIRVILRKEFIQMLREPQMRGMLFLAPLIAAADLRLCRDARRRPRAHCMEGYEPHPGEPRLARTI